MEDNILKDMGMAAKMASLQVSKTSTPRADDFLPVRPAYGTKGTEVVLWTNYFALDVKTPSLYSYAIKTEKKEPERKEGTEPPKEKPTAKGKGNGKGKEKDDKKKIEAKGMKLRSIIQLALDEVAKGISYATEFKGQVVSLSPLKLPDEKKVTVRYTEEGREEIWDVKFDSQPDVNMDALRSYIRSMQAPPSEDRKFPRFSDAIDALGIITGFWARSNDKVGSVGRSRYFPLDMESEKNSLGSPDFNTLVRGYFQSARPATGRLLLNANVTHGVFRPSGLVSKMMDDFGLNNPARSLNEFLSRLRARIRIMAEKGVPGSKEKIFKKLITGIATPQDNKGITNGPKVKREAAGPSEVSFYLNGDAPPGLKTGQYCTVSQYYLAKYGYRPNDKYPVVKCGQQKPTYFPAELCQVIEGQLLGRKTTPDETANMILHACRSPWANATSLSTVGRKVLGLEGNPKLTEFKVTAGKELLTVRGRELVPPSITYLNMKRRETNIQTSDGGWNMRSVKVLKPGRPISKFTYLTVHYGSASDQVTPSMKAFIEHMRTTGLNIPAQGPYEPPAEAYIPRGANPKDILRPMFGKLSQDPPDMLFVVLPGRKTDESIYNAIKCLGDVEFGIPTVCVLQNNFIKSQLQYFANVALKVNLKMGGANHKLSTAIPLIKEGKTMVVGYDVTHPTNLGRNADSLPSLVGIVASIDQDLGQWPAAAWAQDSKKEMLDEALLKEKFGERLNLWRKHNKGQLPQNILIFRDGVSEGQFSQVLTLELPSIRAACTALYPAKQSPKISIVVSVKRHQTRFYPTDPNHMTASRNIKNGTVVDRGVTQATVWDFFLTAHSALQGTARPAHYTVLLDEIFRSNQGTGAADGLQTLTHEMCYLFGRATKAVSICPPAYYADIICTRQRVYMHEAFERSNTQSVATSVAGGVPFKDVHPRLRDTMYYI
ncbi:Piwi-domain-containing protein [Rostrohypoxylon terebratum]|nr:Piwi-domain-containing protein [Rostrohypoxylon terebratum]